MRTAPLPVTLVTGFLGAGKTTLVNRVLRERHGERIAVVVNEFGEVGIDGRLVVAREEELVELANGCLCCSVRGDLVEALGRLVAGTRRLLARRPLDRILIETSGLASPGPILQTLRLEPGLASTTTPSGVTCLVGAPRGLETLAAHREAAEQVAHATTLVVGHADRAGEAELCALEAELARRNPLARRLRATRAELPLEAVLDPGDPPLPVPAASEPRHGSPADAVVLRARVPLDLHRLKMWLSFLANRRKGELWRIKGLVRCHDEPRAVVVQAVHELLELGPSEDLPAPEESLLVLLGRDLDPDELRRGWSVCTEGRG